jgi:AcrR family transcriptional regulator
LKVEVDVKSLVTDAVLVEKRRGQIAAAAVELFSERGFYRTTIQEVARKAGVSTGLIYQYVHDKEDVLLLALLSVLDAYKERIPAALDGVVEPLERLWRAVDAYCHVVDGSRAATVLAYRSTKSLPPERRELIKAHELATNAMIADCIRACIAAGLFRAVNVELATYHFVMFAHAWALKHWRLRQICGLEEYIAQGFDFLTASLLTPAGRRRYARFRKVLQAAGSRAR